MKGINIYQVRPKYTGNICWIRIKKSWRYSTRFQLTWFIHLSVFNVEGSWIQQMICFPWGNPGYSSDSVILLSVQQMHSLPVESWGEWDFDLNKFNRKTPTVFPGTLILVGIFNILTYSPQEQGRLPLWVCKRVIQNSMDHVWISLLFLQ